MRFRVPLFALLFAVGSFALPLAAHAGIPFFGPIIPSGFQSCAAGWGAVIIVINNVISLLITLAIVFIAPIMIAWSGFLFVVNPVNSGGISQAKGILLHTIVGIVIALCGWLIVDAIMVVLFNPGASSGTTRLTTWSNLITGGGNYCLPQAASGYVPGAPLPPSPTVGVACSVPALTSPPFTDPLAQQMESMNGNAVIWTSTAPQLQACANKFTSVVGGHVTSAYRPQAYQTHLWEIRDRWCTRALRSNSDLACSSLKSSVSNEATKHFGSSWMSNAANGNCGAVGSTSRHTAGDGVDISGVDQTKVTPTVLAQSCLSPGNYGASDPWHYNLVAGCTCQ